MSRGRCHAGAVLSACLFLVAAPAQDAVSVRTEVKRLLAQQRAAEARAVLDRAIAASPADVGLLLLRVRLRSMGKDFDGAIDDATKAIALAPQNADLVYERAFARYGKGQLREALADYDAAAALAPWAAKIHGERADVLCDLDEPLAAIAAYDRAIALAPKWTEAWNGRGRARRRLTDFPGAMADFRRASELQPEEWVFHYQLCCVAFDSRDDATAKAAGEQMVRRAPAEYRAQLLDEYARMLWRLGDVSAALSKLGQGIDGAADEAVAAPLRLSLGCVLLAGDDRKAAASELAAAAHAIDAELAPFVALMQWCVDARKQGLEPAGRALLAATAALPDPLTAAQQQLVDQCLRGEAIDLAAPELRQEPRHACPLLFFAAWRARCAGDEPTALRLLRCCVNTGGREWMQWTLAAVLLRAADTGKPVKPSLGARIEFAAREPGEAAVVQAVDPNGAAAWQGLCVGDEIIGLGGVPITRAAWAAIDARAREGLDLLLKVRRGDESKELYVRLGLGD